MHQFPRGVLLCWLISLGIVACTKGQQSGSSAEPSPPPGIRYEANLAAGGVAPPAVSFRNSRTKLSTDGTAGGNLFASMNCDGCHGGGAPGWVGPSLIDGRWRYGGADEEVFASIYYGRPKGMPAYGGVIGADGVWMLVAYLKSQPVPDVVPTTSYQDMDRPSQANVPTAGPTTATTAQAAPTAPEQMLTAYGCTACHAVDHKVVGPSLMEVAAKYKGSDAEKALAMKVRDGGSGVWGTIPMTPNPQVSDQDLHSLIRWVLAL